MEYLRFSLSHLHRSDSEDVLLYMDGFMSEINAAAFKRIDSVDVDVETPRVDNLSKRSS